MGLAGGWGRAARGGVNNYGFVGGPETTVVTGPLLGDGTVDYAGACNEALGKGVTPEKNAVVWLVKALGSRRVFGDTRGKRLGLLGAQGSAGLWVDYEKFAKVVKWEPGPGPAGLAPVGVGAGGPPFGGGEGPDYRPLHKAGAGPWKAETYPEVDAWLQANEKALGYALEAAECPRYWWGSIWRGCRGIFMISCWDIRIRRRDLSW